MQRSRSSTPNLVTPQGIPCGISWDSVGAAKLHQPPHIFRGCWIWWTSHQEKQNPALAPIPRGITGPQRLHHIRFTCQQEGSSVLSSKLSIHLGADHSFAAGTLQEPSGLSLQPPSPFPSDNDLWSLTQNRL